MRRHLAAERLEQRHLPSSLLPGLTATDPADGATVLHSPQAITITLDQGVVDQIETDIGGAWSIPPDQVLPMILSIDFDQDVEIDRVGPDGSLTPFAGGAAAAVEETIATSTAADGTTSTALVVTLTSDPAAMQPGTYQIEILPQTVLAGVFGSETDPIWFTATDPIPIARFTLESPGPTIAGATDLGTVGAQPQGVWASLQPSHSQSAVALYRFTLPQGGSWQLDAKALASSIGSRALPALALLGPDGRVLATRNNGSGTSASPDPELFQDLPGGTYYLGVSAAGNLPGTDGGYDPSTGRPGTVGGDQPAGVFELEVSATPAIPPSQVVGFDLDHADPLEPSPTGLDLTFSGPVDVGPLARPDQQESSVMVVDASGRTWPITPVHYQPSEHLLSFVFDEALPPGLYSLVVPSQGGLTDLAGNPVLGPSGDPPGVLASWTVAAPTGPADPNDLGVLWPGPLNVTQAPGVSRSVTLEAGQEVDDRFVVIYPGIYSLQTQVGTGSFAVGIETADGTTILDIGNLTGLSRTNVALGVGVYELRMVADGTMPSSIAWLLKPISLDYEKISTNGVGQAPALTLALVGSAPGSDGASTSPAWSGGPSASSTAADVTADVTAAGATPEGVTATDGTPPIPVSREVGGDPGRPAAPGSPAGLLLTLESSPIGLPAPGAWPSAPVGPMADGAAVVLADAESVASAGLRSPGSSAGTDPRVGEGDLLAGPEATPRTLPPAGETPLTSEPGGPEAASARADAKALALAQADPLIRIAGWLAGRIGSPALTPGEPEPPTTGFGATLIAAATAPEDTETDVPARDQSRATLAQADLGIPFILLVGTAMTYRLSQPVRKWWRRHHIAHPSWPRPHGFARVGRPVPRV